jgi:hypothetical protein
MKVVCAWCQQEGRSGVIGEREPVDDPTETHGVCAVHAERLLEQLPSMSFPGIRMLIVVRRTESGLYDHLSRALGPLADVAVILDRRQRDRRQTPGTPETERRRGDRRVRTSPFSSLGYLSVRFGARRQGAGGLPPVRRLRAV